MAGDSTETGELMDDLVVPAETREQPTDGLVSGTVGDRCVSCGSPLSSDQRYCVVCGERRGAPRFSLPAPVAATAEAAPRPPRPPRRARAGSGTTLVAGVATLLLALLVGVLIGHSSANGTTTVTGGGTKIITVGAGVAAPASTTPASGSKGSSSGGSAAKSGPKSGSKTKPAKPAKKSAPISKKTAKQLSSAASKVTGGSGAGAAPPTVTQGGACTPGTAGCNGKTKKFTGHFFG